MVCAIIGDVHGNYEALKTVIEEIKKRKIDNIYCLGDVVGLGPNPSECLDLIIDNNIKMIAGNAEDYIIFGPESFPYLHNPEQRYQNAIWTKNHLRKDQIEYLKKLPHSMEIIEEGKKIGLCHFPVDPRYDYSGVYNYLGKNTKAFYRTNTKLDKRFTEHNKMTESANTEPLFGGKKITYYDMVIYGHYHFEKMHKRLGLKLFSVNGTGVAINSCATFVTLVIKNNRITKITNHVPYDRDKTIKALNKSDMPNKERFLKYISREDIYY